MVTFPAGTVTFLFTDIEASTQLWERHPEAMQVAAARHDALLQQTIAAHQGRVVKMTGDGCHAVFATAIKGAAAALSAQQALNIEPWEGLQPDSLRVRMGLHTGEAEARAGDYFGSAVNRAARLMAVGHGGQILLSAVTSSLVRDGLPDGAALLDLGEHRLKDLERPERVFQLAAPPLPAGFPPLKSLDWFPNNLPVQLTSFVGREKEIEAAARLLGAARLLTLTGSGGTGKTRLALQLAAEALPAFADGAWLVELAPLADPALIPATIASAFKLREQPGQPPLALVTDYLRAKRLLLILDNCEHLIAACARLADDLLRACPHLKILASSREALGVAGETIFHVPSLSLPEARPAAPDVLSRCEAVQLLVQRALAARPNFALTAQNAPAVAQICRRLDGIPLALELAAARIRLFTPEQIAARLDDRFRLLTGGSRTALPRQQTLRALIDWSYDLLPEPERALLRRLSVFAGGWTYEAAEAVCAEADLLELLAHLVDKSLVLVEESAGQARYKLLETVRQYARERLFESGETVAVRDRHLDYCLRFAESAQPRLQGPEALAWLDRLDLEHDNIRAALEWALENDPVAALRLASMFGGGPQRSNASESHAWLTAALARAETLPLAEGAAALVYQAIKAWALVALASAYFGLGNSPASHSVAEEAVRLARQIGDSKTLAFALGMHGLAAATLGQVEVAGASAEEAIAICREKGDAFVLGLALSPLAILALFVTRDFARARALNEESFRLARETGNPWSLAMAQLGMARLAALSGELPEARRQFQESAGRFRQIHDRHFTNVCRSELGHALRWHGAYAEALAVYREALAEWRELGLRAAAAHELECFAFIAGAQGQARRAARLLGAAESLRDACGSPMMGMERSEYDEAVSQLRAQAGAAIVDSGWAEGRALGMEAAVAYALEDSPAE